MLLAFRASNFRSLREEQELSLVRTARGARMVDAGNGEATSVTAIYGANASGKSNILAALKFMRDTVLHSHSDWSEEDGVPTEPFLFDEETASAPSRFEVDLKWEKNRYRYGFEISNQIVLSEWLYAYPTGRRQTLFERDSTRSDPYYFGKHLAGRNRVIAELTRDNSLFLSTAAASRHERLAELAHWFRSHLRTADVSDETMRLIFTAKEIFNNPDSAQAIIALLKAADLGICDVDVKKREGRFEESIPRESRSRRRKQSIESINTGQYLVQFKHKGNADSDAVSLPIECESLGTRSLFALAGPILLVLRTQTTLLVDEIDRSLHPRLVAEVIRMFKDPRINKGGAQLVFTSHDTSFLGGLISEEALLDRDQVWFTEKDQLGATQLYPLTDFSPRRVENLERGYLQGRYGGVPLLESRSVAKIMAAFELTGEHER